jgi:hypothetical protein
MPPTEAGSAAKLIHETEALSQRQGLSTAVKEGLTTQALTSFINHQQHMNYPK